MNKLTLIFLIILTWTITYARTNDIKLYDKIIEHSKKGDHDKAVALSNIFTRKHPKSKKIAPVRFLQAENEKNPQKAIKYFEFIYKFHKNYIKRDLALYRACQITYLISDWPKLKSLSLGGIKNLRNSKYRNNFRLYFILSNIYNGNYDTAGKECLRLIDLDRNYQRMAYALLVLSYINKKKTGYSREYITNLRDISAGYKKSEILQTVIFLLGDFYEKKGYYNRAYSAYFDLIKKFPNSPEASFARRRNREIIKLKPKKTQYFPDDDLLSEFDSIDIKPDDDVYKYNKKKSYYSISIGPFSSLKEAKKIQSIIKGFSFIKTIKVIKKYKIFIEKTSSIENALKIKIRLAEEYGINGQIIRISTIKNKKYIYRE